MLWLHIVTVIKDVYVICEYKFRLIKSKLDNRGIKSDLPCKACVSCTV